MRLQVLICAYGAEGIRRVARGSHPRMEGVRYTVSWQAPEGDVPPEIRGRDDFSIHPVEGKGLSKNRNAALRHASAPILLISDDDLSYTESDLRSVLEAFDAHPDADVLCFTHRRDNGVLPDSARYGEFPLDRQARGWYPTSFEIAFRNDGRPIPAFDEDFGIGAEYPAGEEVLFLHALLAEDRKGYFLPIPIATHPGDTTTERDGATPGFIRMKGALHRRLHPADWPLRMATHALRRPDGWSVPAYCRQWLKGAGWCDSGKWLTVALLTVMTAFYCLMYYWTPFQLDDYIFRSVYFENNGWDSGFSLRAMAGYISDIRAADNSRWANVMSPFSTTIQPWAALFPWVTGVLTSLLIFLIARTIRKDFWAILALTWGAVFILLPWRNALFVADYALNYVWGAVINVVFILLTIRYMQTHKGFAWVCMAAILSGVWHEGFTLPTLAGLLVMTLTTRLKRDARWWVVGFVCLALCICNFLSEGMIRRLSNGGVQGAVATPVGLKGLVDYAALILGLAVMAAGACFSRGRTAWKRCLKDPAFLTFAVAGLCGAVFSLLLQHSPRMAFYPGICYIAATGIFIRECRFRSRNALRMLRIGGILSAVCCMAFSVSILTWTYRFYRQDRVIMRLMDQSATGTVFYDIIMPEEVPIYTLAYPAKSQYVDYITLWGLAQSQARDEAAVVPTSLREARPADSESLGGGYYRKGNAIYMEPGNLDGTLPVRGDYRLDGGSFEVTFTDGSHEEIAGVAFPYRNAYGERYVYLKPYRIPTESVSAIRAVGFKVES